MTLTNKQFIEAMNTCTDEIIPFLRTLETHEDGVAAVALGILVGAFLATRRTQEIADQASHLMRVTLEECAKVKPDMQRRFQ